MSDISYSFGGALAFGDGIAPAVIEDAPKGGTYSLGATKSVDENPLWWASEFSPESLNAFLGYPEGYVTGRTAMQNAAALICMDVLAQDISKATLRLKRRIKGGAEEVEPKKHPLALMLALEPNRRHTWIEFVQMVVYHLCMGSNSYIYVRRTLLGDPLGMVPVMPGRVQDKIDQKTGEVFYTISAGTIAEAAMIGAWTVDVPERDMIHIRQRMLDGFWGTSTLAAGSSSLRLSAEIARYSRQLFEEEGLYRGYFVREGEKLNDDLFARVKQQLRKLVDKNARRREPMLVEDGIKYQEMGMSAADARASEAFDAAIEEVCRLWRMPPHKAMHLKAVKYENLVTLEQAFVRDTLVPICKLIEARFGKMLLTAEERLEYFFEFDRDEMKIFDEKAEAEEAIKMGERGFITHNEVRTSRGWNPRKGGDLYTLPANAKWVDAAGKTIATGAKVETPADGEKGDEDPDGGEPRDGSEEPGNKQRHLKVVA